MASLIIAGVIVILITIWTAFATSGDKFDKTLNSFMAFIISGVIALFCIVFIGILAPYEGYDEYPIVTHNDRVFYLHDDKLCDIESKTYQVICDADVKAPQYRIVHYDNTIFVKSNSYELVLPA